MPLDDVKQGIRNMYRRYNPCKLGQVDALLAAHAGRERELACELRRKSVPPTRDTQAREMNSWAAAKAARAEKVGPFQALFQTFATELCGALAQKDGPAKDSAVEAALASKGDRATVAVVALAAGRKNFEGTYFCKGTCGRCEGDVGDFREATICPKCGVATYCSEACAADDAAAHAEHCEASRVEGGRQYRVVYRDEAGERVAGCCVAKIVLGDGTYHCCANFYDAHPLIRLNETIVEGISGAELARALGDLDSPEDVNDAGPEVNGTPALVTAALVSNVDAVRELLDFGADVDAASSFGATAVIGAAQNGDREVVALLAERGANLDAIDANGATALCAAVLGGHEGRPRLESIALLLELGADVDECGLRASELCRPPLGLACAQLLEAAQARAPLEDWEAAIEALAARGADCDGVAGKPRPLECVAPFSPRATAALLRAGADPNVKVYAKGAGCLAAGPPLALKRRLEATWAWSLEAVADGEDFGVPADLVVASTPLVKVIALADDGVSACENPSLSLLLDFGADPDLFAIVSPMLVAILREDARTVAALLDAGSDPDTTLNFKGMANIQGLTRETFAIKPEAQRAITTREFVGLHFDAAHPVGAAFGGGAAVAAAVRAARADEVRVARLESPDFVEVPMFLAHLRRANPALLVEVDAYLARVASGDAGAGSYAAPPNVAPLPNTAARTLLASRVSWRRGAALQALDDAPDRSRLVGTKAEFDAAVADGRFGVAAGDWAYHERAIATAGRAVELRAENPGDPLTDFANALLDAPEVAASAPAEEHQLFARCVSVRVRELALRESAAEGARVPESALEVLLRGDGCMTDGGSYFARWSAVGVAAMVDVIAAIWADGRPAAGYRWATFLVRTLMLAGAVQTAGEDRVAAWEAAVAAAVGLRAKLAPLDGFAEREAAGFAVLSKTYLRSLRLRVLDACEARGRALDAAGRARVLDRAAVHALNIMQSCKRGGGAKGGFAGTELKLTNAVDGDVISLWAPPPDDAYNRCCTHFTQPLAAAAFVLGLRARRDGSSAAVAYFVRAAAHFPADDLKKVVATWLAAEAAARGGATVGAVRNIARAAAAVETHFAAGAFGAAVADEDLVPRNVVRSLLRGARGRGDGDAFPGVAPAAGAVKGWLALFEGDGPLCGLIGATCTDPPNARSRRRSCAACGRRRAPGDPKFRKCTRCSSVVYCDDACQKSHWPNHKLYCRKPPMEGLNRVLAALGAAAAELNDVAQ